jgi:predicted aconitase with swiveling domain
MSDEVAALVAGTARGRAQVLEEPLSLWGGLDPETGAIIDVHHPQHGVIVAGSVLVMPFGRGSSSSASTLLEAVRLRTHPAAVVLAEADDILVLGAIVARALYGVGVPVVVLPSERLRIYSDG